MHEQLILITHYFSFILIFRQPEPEVRVEEESDGWVFVEKDPRASAAAATSSSSPRRQHLYPSSSGKSSLEKKKTDDCVIS